MRSKLLASLLLATAAPVWSGPIAGEFSSGYEGISWGLPLADLVGMLPQGEHYFSTAPGERVYIVRNDDPLLGVPRIGYRVQYHLGKDGGVESIAVGIPYDRYQQLLGALVSQFGPYAVTRQVGTATGFWWKEDQGIVIAVRISREPRYGIAEFWVGHASSSRGKSPTK